MIKINDKKLCCGCEACKWSCPKKCIEMVRDEEGFLYPLVDADKCVNCGICTSVCPMINNEDSLSSTNDNTFAAFSNCEKREESSSGGIFNNLAQRVISLGGIVYGVKMREDFKGDEYCRIDSMNYIDALLGSKYIEAEDNSVFFRVKSDLDENCTVLFSGTPCKIFGLKKYLNKEYENLICVDLVCHGVPSSLVWRKHLDYIQNKYKSKLTNVSFRSKKNGWNNYGMKYEFNNKSYFVDKWSDYYMILFLKNLDLRPSCYSCPFKGKSDADITLGDYWGIQSFFPNLNDDKGISAVITRSNKGNALIQELSLMHEINLIESDFDDFISYNTAAISSTSRPSERNGFFSDLNDIGYKKTIKKYVYNDYCGRVTMLLIDLGLWQHLKKVKSILKRLNFKK